MQRSDNSLTPARLALLAALALCLGSTGATAQSIGYTVIGGKYESDPAPGLEKTSSIRAPEAAPSSIEEIPDVGVTADDAGKPQEAAVRPMTEAEKNVRVVGPKFLPDPEGAINLRAPDQPRAR
ncbi:hypothetical protein [Chelativorans sp. AA-79]|uniref:hypothetical protein n=1 Tax=Chelativorans sp. AA-79 TaxID=3028735 RepID=UPI0023F8F998|nr:hypothetical protein [Chelativorans sp. AA-79]WEX11578.1 hypothetical protein PVE73_11955 [Chelativorans sp. AA-79]